MVDDVHTQEALSTAELLLEQGKRVEVISPLFYVGQDIGVTSIAPLYTRLFTRGVVLTPGTELRAVEGSTVVVANVYSGVERRIESVDTVVLAAGSRSTDSLYRALKGQVAQGVEGFQQFLLESLKRVLYHFVAQHFGLELREQLRLERLAPDPQIVAANGLAAESVLRATVN